MRRIGAVMATLIAAFSLAVSPAQAAQSVGTIAGHITSAASGAGLPQFGVRVLDSRGIDWADAVTDDTGAYSTQAIPAGRYVVCVADYGPPPDEGVGYLRRCTGNVPWNGDRDVPAGAQRVTVSSGATTTVDLALPLAAGIRGRVLDATAGTPVADAYVYAFTGDGQSAGDYNAHTGINGVYNLGRLDPDLGPFTMCFLAGPADDPSSYYPTAPYAYVPQCYNRTPWDGHTVPAGGNAVPVIGGQTVEGIGARLTPAGAITGTIRDPSGMPVNSAEVIAYAPDGHFVRSAGTNDGKYSMALPAGSYRVCVSGQDSGRNPRTGLPPIPGYASQCWPSQPWTDIDTPLPDTATPVAVSAGQATTGINARLQPGGQIRVTVLDAAGQPIGAFHSVVRLYTSTGTSLVSGYTSSSSRVSFGHLISSTSGYPVCAEGYLRSDGQPPVQPMCWPDVAWAGGNAPVPAAARRIKMAVGQQRSITITLPDGGN